MISVVIPIYNKAHTIERTLMSVMAQTYTKFEVIIVNDGSTDNSIEQINDFTTDLRVRIVQQHNQGVSVARNKGVSLAKNDYIAFLDGDDEWLPTYLEKMKIAIELYPRSGMYCCAGLYKESDDQIKGYRIAKKYKNKITPINYFENPHVFSHTSATIVHKDEFNQCDGFPIGMKKNEDFALFYSLAIIAPVIYCGFPLTCYYGKVEGQATSIASIDNKLEMDVISRFNLVHKIWRLSERENKLYEVWLKYELRHIFVAALRDQNYKLINLVLKNMEQSIKDVFTSLELGLIKRKPYNRFAVFYILVTKLIWRSNKYPRTGKG